MNTSRADLMTPASGCTAPESTPVKVDLPAPFSPSKTRTSPAATSKSTPFSACTPPKRFRILSNSRWQAVITCRSWLLANTRDDPDRELEVVAALHQRRVDGIIVAPSTVTEKENRFRHRDH